MNDTQSASTSGAADVMNQAGGISPLAMANALAAAQQQRQEDIDTSTWISVYPCYINKSTSVTGGRYGVSSAPLRLCASAPLLTAPSPPPPRQEGPAIDRGRRPARAAYSRDLREPAQASHSTPPETTSSGRPRARRWASQGEALQGRWGIRQPRRKNTQTVVPPVRRAHAQAPRHVCRWKANPGRGWRDWRQGPPAAQGEMSIDDRRSSIDDR